MTFKERLEIEHPEKIKEVFAGGCADCPKTYEYEISSAKDCMIDSCEHCWNRKIPVEKFRIGDKVKLRKGLKIDGIYFNNDKATDGITFFDFMFFEGEQEIKEILPNGNVLLSENFYSPVMLEKVEEKGAEREMNKEFTKEDLKDGMLIERKSGDRFLWFNNLSMCIDSFVPNIEEDLKLSCSSRYAIVKIGYPNKEARTLKELLTMDFSIVLWERDKPKIKHMRFSEAISVLKKYYNVDIVQIKED